MENYFTGFLYTFIPVKLESHLRVCLPVTIRRWNSVFDFTNTMNVSSVRNLVSPTHKW